MESGSIAEGIKGVRVLADRNGKRNLFDTWRKPSTAPTLYLKKGVIRVVSVSGLVKAIKRVLTLGRAK